MGMGKLFSPLSVLNNSVKRSADYPVNVGVAVSQ